MKNLKNGGKVKNMIKSKRKWVKDEKRIVSLLYKKGFLTDFKIEDLYWAEYNWFGKKIRRSKFRKYKYPVYMPEIHYSETDYWGETTEYSIVSHINNVFYWDNSSPEDDDYSKSSFKKMTREQLIHYLMKFPTIISDNKINKVLNKVILY